MDITSYVKSASAEMRDGNLYVTAVTSAQSENYLNPEYFAKAIAEKYDLNGEDTYHEIFRGKMTDADGKVFR